MHECRGEEDPARQGEDRGGEEAVAAATGAGGAPAKVAPDKYEKNCSKHIHCMPEVVFNSCPLNKSTRKQNCI